MERDQNVRDRNRAGYDADLVDATLDNDEFLEETAAEVAPTYRTDNGDNGEARNDADLCRRTCNRIYCACAFDYFLVYASSAVRNCRDHCRLYSQKTRSKWLRSMGNGYRCSFLGAWHIHHPVFLTEKA